MYYLLVCATARAHCSKTIMTVHNAIHIKVLCGAQLREVRTPRYFPCKSLTNHASEKHIQIFV